MFKFHVSSLNTPHHCSWNDRECAQFNASSDEHHHTNSQAEHLRAADCATQHRTDEQTIRSEAILEEILAFWQE